MPAMPPPAQRPTMYFIGVTTGQSSINRVFPQWSKILGIEDATLVGLDFPIHDHAEHYRQTVQSLKDDPLSLGALVTTHKMDLFSASHDLFDEIDPLSRSMGEISSIYKRGDELFGRTVDPTNSGKALRTIVADDHWASTSGEVFIIGAGGAGLAITWYLAQPDHVQPSRVTISDCDPARIKHMQAFHSQLGQTATEFAYELSSAKTDNDAILDSLPPGSLVINATGLGKDAPGSPLTSAARFPTGAIAWDLNYRGDLVFLEQAAAQPSVAVFDGWSYFIYGWSSVIADVFDLSISDRSPLLKQLSAAAAVPAR